MVAGSSSWTNNQRVVTGTCSDTGGSGCRGNITHTYNYDIKTSSGGAAGNGNGGTVYDRADNSVACAANQTVKVDRTAPYVTVNVAPGNYDTNDGKTVTATCNDKLSGLSNKFDRTFTANTYSPMTGWHIGKCCADNAGNEMCDAKGPYNVRHECRHKTCPPEEYNKCRTSGCGVGAYKTCQKSVCGVDYYVWNCCSNLGGSTCFTRNSLNHPYGGRGYCGKISTVYKKCSKPACGVSYYNYCEDPACGVKVYSICWHY